MRVEAIDRLERVLGRVLGTGVIVSASLLAFGLILALAVPASGAASSILRAGLMVLLLTPVARVVASVFEYARDRDWLFASITFLVLVIVLASLLVGALGG